MTVPTPGDVTGLLKAWQAGEEGARDLLVERVYGELRVIAARHVRRERREASLVPTALVHEAFVRLIDQTRVDWNDRAHFFAVASRIMRRVLVDRARRRHADKRRGIHVTLGEVLGVISPGPAVDLAALEGALASLEARHPREARVVELRYFAGLTNEEAAACLGIGVATVKRDWTFARSFLKRELDGRPARG